MTSSSALRFRREERLAQGPRGDVWRVRVPEGRVMVAKQAIKPTRGERGQLRDLVRRGRTLQAPLVPFVELFEAGADVWVLREFDSGVPLSKLALSSPLSHRQAAGTAAACLQALSQLHGAGLCHGRVHGGNVFVEPDGSIRIVDAGIGGPPSHRDRRARWADDMKATAALVYTVWPDWEYEAGRLVYDLLEAGRMGDAAAARQGLELLAASLPPAENTPSADLALAALGVRLLDGEATPVQPPAAAASRRTEQVPAAAAAPIANIWTEASRELPADPLIATQPNGPPIAMPPSPPPIMAPPGPPPVTPAMPPPIVTHAVPPGGEVRVVSPPVYCWVPAPARPDSILAAATRVVTEPAVRLASLTGERARIITRRLPRQLVTRRMTQVGAAVAASAAVVLGVVIGHAVAPTWPAGGRAPGPQSAGGSRAQATIPAPQPASPTLHPAAPASAGFVTQVELVPLSECETGGHCTFKSVLHLQGPHAAADLTWDVVAVDGCSGAQSVLSTSSSTLDPSWNQVWAADQYSVPSTHPTLLYAVAESPYRVASAPLAINGSATCTPGA